MKTCTKCETEKEEKLFIANSNWCRDCKRQYDRDRYKRIGSHHWTRTRGNKRAEVKEWFSSFKKELSCVRCGENHPACLDFHHLDRTTKKDTISNMACKGRPIRVILEEIAKCICICANCHRKEHWQ